MKVKKKRTVRLSDAQNFWHGCTKSMLPYLKLYLLKKFVVCSEIHSANASKPFAGTHSNMCPRRFCTFAEQMFFPYTVLQIGGLYL